MITAMIYTLLGGNCHKIATMNSRSALKAGHVEATSHEDNYLVTESATNDCGTVLEGKSMRERLDFSSSDADATERCLCPRQLTEVIKHHQEKTKNKYSMSSCGA